jgi:hypothetical protein
MESEPETFQLRTAVDGHVRTILPVFDLSFHPQAIPLQYIKIIPLSSWAVHGVPSIWCVTLTGCVDHAAVTAAETRFVQVRCL